MIEVGNRDARDCGGANALQEREHDQDYQYDGDDQCLLGVAQRLPNGLGPVNRDSQIDVTRQRCGQARQLRLHVVDGCDDVRARLAQQRNHDARLSVNKTSVAQILDRVVDLGDVGQTDRGAVAISDNKVAILRRLRRLVVGVDLIVGVVVLDRPLGTVGVGRGERRADVL
jgi:hypothetical protein